MKRRTFLQATTTGLAATTVAAPAIAQSSPAIQWRLASGVPKSLDTLYGGAEHLCRSVAEATEGRFVIQPFSAGELVPAFGVADAVSNKTIECGHTFTSYHTGRDTAFAFGTNLPFGLNPRQMNAWLYHGGGNELLNEFYGTMNLYGIPAGNTGIQMGGWFKKEIKTLADLQGLRFRIGGLGGRVVQALGVIPQQIAGGDVYPALERGTIDAAEWVGPYDDEKLGFNKVAPYYYYPGWWDCGDNVTLLVNLEVWNQLPAHYKKVLSSACSDTSVWMQAKYDAGNPAALRRLVAAGAQLRPFSREILEACFAASTKLYAELSATNPNFKKLHDSYMAFRKEEYLWWQVAEYSYDTFMLQVRAQH